MQKEIVSTLLKSQKTYNRGMIVLAGASASGKTEDAVKKAWLFFAFELQYNVTINN